MTTTSGPTFVDAHRMLAIDEAVGTDDDDRAGTATAAALPPSSFSSSSSSSSSSTTAADVGNAAINVEHHLAMAVAAANVLQSLPRRTPPAVAFDIAVRDHNHRQQQQQPDHACPGSVVTTAQLQRLKQRSDERRGVPSSSSAAQQQQTAAVDVHAAVAATTSAADAQPQQHHARGPSPQGCRRPSPGATQQQHQQRSQQPQPQHPPATALKALAANVQRSHAAAGGAAASGGAAPSQCLPPPLLAAAPATNATQYPPPYSLPQHPAPPLPVVAKRNNRAVVTNALRHVCLPGAVNRPLLEIAVRLVEEEPAETVQFVILLKEEATAFRGLYAVRPAADSGHGGGGAGGGAAAGHESGVAVADAGGSCCLLSRMFGAGPAVIRADVVGDPLHSGTDRPYRAYKFDTGSKRFSSISASLFSNVVDAVTLWPKLRNGAPPL